MSTGEGQHGVTLRGYLTGFALSVALTGVAFWLVMAGVIHGAAAAAFAVVALAIVQILVQTRFFLHVDTRGEGGWTLMTFAFTAIVIAITLIGTLWIMYHLNTNMMPMSANAMRQMP